MAAKVLYKQGTKSTYLSLLTKNPNALYFCTDTYELYKGDSLYSDGLRFVANYNELPKAAEAADGKLYICTESGNGYALNESRDGWAQIIFAPDNKTIVINENGHLSVKAIGMSQVDGLTSELKRIEAKIISGGGQVDAATHDSAGIVKPSDEFELKDDGAMSIRTVDASKVDGLNEMVDTAVEARLVWTDMDS